MIAQFFYYYYIENLLSSIPPFSDSLTLASFITKQVRTNHFYVPCRNSKYMIFTIDQPSQFFSIWHFCLHFQKVLTTSQRQLAIAILLFYHIFFCHSQVAIYLASQLPCHYFPPLLLVILRICHSWECEQERPNGKYCTG